MDKQKLYQLSAMLANLAEGMYQPNSGGASMARGLRGSAQSAIQAEAVKKAKEEEEKKNKGGMFGSIGSTLGSIAGVAAAPFTGGASLAVTGAMGALGGATGGALGTLAGGGQLSGQQLLGYGLQGGLSGATAWAMPKVMDFANGLGTPTPPPPPPPPATTSSGAPNLSGLSGARHPAAQGVPGGSGFSLFDGASSAAAALTPKQQALQNVAGLLMGKSILGGMGLDPIFNPSQRTTMEMRRRPDGTFEPIGTQNVWGY